MAADRNARSFVLTYFSGKGGIPADTDGAMLSVDYFAAGLIDSFAFVELISQIEGVLGINLEAGDLENPQFRTIGGLIEILEGKLRTGG